VGGRAGGVSRRTFLRPSMYFGYPTLIQYIQK